MEAQDASTRNKKTTAEFASANAAVVPVGACGRPRHNARQPLLFDLGLFVLPHVRPLRLLVDAVDCELR